MPISDAGQPQWASLRFARGVLAALLLDEFNRRRLSERGFPERSRRRRQPLTSVTDQERVGLVTFGMVKVLDRT
jgi:hypothetical protein